MVVRVVNVSKSRNLIVKSMVFPLCSTCRFPYNLVVFHFYYSILDTIDHIGEETMENYGRCIWTPLAVCLGSNPDTIGVSIQCQFFCSITTEDPYFGKLGLYINLLYANLKTVHKKCHFTSLYSHLIV